MFQIAKSAVDEPTGCRGGCATEIVLLQQERLISTQAGFPKDSGTIDTRTNNYNIVFWLGRTHKPLILAGLLTHTDPFT